VNLVGLGIYVMKKFVKTIVTFKVNVIMVLVYVTMDLLVKLVSLKPV